MGKRNLKIAAKIEVESLQSCLGDFDRLLC